MKKSVVSLILFCVACSIGKGSSTTEGKVVDGSRKPLSGIKIVATKKEPLNGYDRFETTTESDGSFVIQGLYPSADYKLSFEAGQCAYVAQTEFISAPKGGIRTLQRKIVLKFPTLEKRSDGVVVDPRTGLEWAPTSDIPVDWNEAKQYVDALSLGGGGWRLPTMEELEGLYKTGQIGCGSLEITGGRSIWASDLRYEPLGTAFNFTSGRGFSTPNSTDNAFDLRSVGVRSKK